MEIVTIKDNIEYQQPSPLIWLLVQAVKIQAWLSLFIQSNR